jgi:hypothetical protein
MYMSKYSKDSEDSKDRVSALYRDTLDNFLQQRGEDSEDANLRRIAQTLVEVLRRQVEVEERLDNVEESIQGQPSSNLSEIPENVPVIPVIPVNPDRYEYTTTNQKRALTKVGGKSRRKYKRKTKRRKNTRK